MQSLTGSLSDATEIIAVSTTSSLCLQIQQQWRLSVPLTAETTFSDSKLVGTAVNLLQPPVGVSVAGMKNSIRLNLESIYTTSQKTMCHFHFLHNFDNSSQHLIMFAIFVQDSSPLTMV